MAGDRSGVDAFPTQIEGLARAAEDAAARL